jgi:allantoinase
VLDRARGKIEIGYDADLAIVDSNDRYTLTKEMLLDRHKLSPYVGREFRGRITRTILRGQTIFRDGNITSAPNGQLVRPS